MTTVISRNGRNGIELGRKRKRIINPKERKLSESGMRKHKRSQRIPSEMRRFFFVIELPGQFSCTNII